VRSPGWLAGWVGGLGRVVAAQVRRWQVPPEVPAGEKELREVGTGQAAGRWRES